MTALLPELSWLSRQMGHSSAHFTEQRYGHWSKKGSVNGAKKLEGAFSI